MSHEARQVSPQQAYGVPDGKAGRGCLAGVGCALLVVVLWWGLVGLAAMRVMGML